MRYVGIRREDKDTWEARSPLVPDDLGALLRACDVDFIVQPSTQRVFTDDDFASVGAVIQEDLADCDIIVAVKEIPSSFFETGKTYVFFSHTIKGQPYNMAMLRRMMELGCHLIDYERITDENNQRLISFSRFAGVAGALDSLWALGQRLQWEGLAPNPFLSLAQTHTYHGLETALEAVEQCGQRIAEEGLPEVLRPFVIGVAGYGRVSQGAQEVIDRLLPVSVDPNDLLTLAGRGDRGRRVHKVIFREEDMVLPNHERTRFDLDDYYRRPDRYHPAFGRFLPVLSVLINAVYWESRYPRLVTKQDVRDLWEHVSRPRLTVVGDVSCDIEGSIEFTVKETHVDCPVFVYDPLADEIVDGVAGTGPVVLAVGNLPCELARDASATFSHTLAAFLPALLAADWDASFEDLEMPAELKRAMILHHGQLTPDYHYLRSFL